MHDEALRPQSIPELSPLDVRDDDVKPAINNALFPLCPSTMTLHEFEELTCAVYSLVMDARNRRR